MRSHIGSVITVSNPTPEVLAWADKELKLENQSYQQALRRNPNSRFYLSPFVSYFTYNKRTDTLTLPRGMMSEFQDFEDGRGKVLDSWRSKITLRPYQTGVPEEIAKHSQGVIRLDTGYGKTIIALRLAEILGQRTLFIVPKLDLLNQFAYEIKEWFNEDPGIIQGEQCSIKTFTVATLQSLRNRLRDGTLNGREFGTVIVDECHQVVPAKSRSVIEAFDAYYRYGLTATLGRSDGQGRAIHYLFGPTLIDRKLERATPRVAIATFNGYIAVDEYADMITAQVENEERNKLIVGIAQEQMNQGRKVLILTKRVNHYDLIGHELDNYRTYRIRSDSKRQERSDTLQSLRKGHTDFDCILGTFSLLSTGIDIPSLDTLIIAGDLKSSVLTEQSAGRILRLFDGKERPLIIDVTDGNNGILRRQSRERLSFYKAQGWTVVSYGVREGQLIAPI